MNSHRPDSDENSHDPDSLDEFDIEEIGINGLGGTAAVPLEAEPETSAGEEAIEEDSAHDAAEDDDGVTSGHSPNFEHLTKPVHRSES
jgi:hypothetical protein